MKYLAILAIALAPLTTSCSPDASQSTENRDPAMAPLEGDAMILVPLTAAGLWRISVLRDGREQGRQGLLCKRAQGVKELMAEHSNPSTCSKRTFKRHSAESYTYKATCESVGEAFEINNRITGDMTTHYRLDLTRTKSSVKRGVRVQNTVVSATRVGDCVSS